MPSTSGCVKKVACSSSVGQPFTNKCWASPLNWGCCLRGWSLVTGTTSSLLSLHAAWLTSLEAGGVASLDVLLGADTDHEGGNIDSLLADSDVLLEDHDTGVMDWVSEVTLLDEGLQSALQELGGSQTEHVIELALVVLEESESDHSADEGLTY